VNYGPRVLSVFFDSGYLFPTLVMLYSAHETMNPNVEFVLGTFKGELRQEDKKNISKILESMNRNFTFIEISKGELASKAEGIDLKAHFGHAALGKIEILHKIPQRHIYSDVDVIFMEGFDSEAEKLDNSSMAGFVPQAAALKNSHLDTDDKNQEFFSGFIVWPTQDNRPLIEIDESSLWVTKYSTHDQAFLNHRLGRHYLQLSPAFCQLDNPKLLNSDYGPGIVHYFGNWKPWHAWKMNRTLCCSTACSWSIWFSRETKSLELAQQLNITGWWRRKRIRAIRGASPNLKRLQLAMLSSRLLLPKSVTRKILRKSFGTRYHLIH
jgi:lipopolysaccharide biosynthesis glycosyltransferase